MKIGFDYWQVISHYPEQIGTLMFSLYHMPILPGEEDNELHVISAVGKNRAGTVKEAVFDVMLEAGYETDEMCTVHEVVFNDPKESPELKLQKCKELGIEMFFDDREDVCRLLNKNGIMAFRVTRKDNSTYDLGAEQK